MRFYLVRNTNVIRMNYYMILWLFLKLDYNMVLYGFIYIGLQRILVIFLFRSNIVVILWLYLAISCCYTLSKLKFPTHQTLGVIFSHIQTYSQKRLYMILYHSSYPATMHNRDIMVHGRGASHVYSIF